MAIVDGSLWFICLNQQYFNWHIDIDNQTFPPHIRSLMTLIPHQIPNVYTL